MASAPTLSKVSLSFVLLFLSLYASSAISHRLILDPKEPVNTIKGDYAGFVPGKIVEKKFSFFGDSGPPVEDLGHHAGYYSLPHSKAAR